ncbi:hypothetical protein PENNAL_c0073G07172, partial [Penicillium nalgiovense]
MAVWAFFFIVHQVPTARLPPTVSMSRLRLARKNPSKLYRAPGPYRTTSTDCHSEWQGSETSNSSRWTLRGDLKQFLVTTHCTSPNSTTGHSEWQGSETSNSSRWTLRVGSFLVLHIVLRQ